MSNASAEGRPSSRIQELDALRAVAALAVLFFHFTSRYAALWPEIDALPAIAPWGHYGVHLFFVISGFVILMTLERCRTAAEFVRARFFRLYPAFWIAVPLTLLVTMTLLPERAVKPLDALVNLTMLPVLFEAQMVDGVYWTLQIELFFYAAMLVLFVLRLLEPRRLVVMLSLWVGVGLALNLAEGRVAIPAQHIVRNLAILAWIPIFALGVVVRLVSEKRRLTVGQGILVALSLSAVGVEHGIEALAFVAGSAALVSFAVLARPRFLRAAPLVHIGVWSYGLYLVHQNIGYAVMRSFTAEGLSPWLGFAGALGITIALAAALHYFVEKPALAWSRALGRVLARTKVKPGSASATAAGISTPMIP